LPFANRFFEGPEQPPVPRDGWTCRRVTAASRLYGANGVTLGPDGRLYVAQFMANRVSAIDPRDESQEVIVPFGSPVAAPDDTTFDSRGAMFITDTMPGRVWARELDGRLRVIADDLPSANGITCYQDRVFVNENRAGGRLLEVYPDGRGPHVVLEDLPHPNAMAVGPDGLLYFPLIGGEIWRVELDGQRLERVIDGLVVPPAAKFDAAGRLVTISSVTGEVLTIDLQSRAVTVVAKLSPGLDNVACHPDGRMFTSHFISGQITALAPDGGQRLVSPPGLIGPAGIAVAGDGQIVAADLLGLISVGPDGELNTIGTLIDPEFPGVVRGLAVGSAGVFYMTTSGGSVVSYDSVRRVSETLAEGYDELMGIAVTGDGSVVVAEAGGGRVILISPDGGAETMARGLDRPTGVALAADGSCFVSDAGAGRVFKLGDDAGAGASGFQSPEGIVAFGDRLFVVDAGAKELIQYRPDSGSRELVCESLAVGEPPGRRHTPLCGDALVPGPLSAMADITIDRHGTLYLSANGEGSMWKIAPARNGSSQGEPRVGIVAPPSMGA
jgi:sugar lactone lactonase YvrE